MKLIEIEITKPEGMNFILGQTHFIKSVEDLYEAMMNVPGAHFGIAFCEASGPCLIRAEGNNDNLKKLAIFTPTKLLILSNGSLIHSPIIFHQGLIISIPVLKISSSFGE